MRRNEYRVTRPELYRSADGLSEAPTIDAAGGRQGHYYMVDTAADAVSRAAADFEDVVFDVQHVKGEGADWTVRRYTRSGMALSWDECKDARAGDYRKARRENEVA